LRYLECLIFHTVKEIGLKRGYLGLFESVYLAGRSAGAEEFWTAKGLIDAEQWVPLDRMVYQAAFQGGIDEFISEIPPNTSTPLDQFIKSKIIVPKKTNPDVLSEIIGAFKPYTRKGDGSVVMIMSFICDLIMAMENNSSVINVSGIPSLDHVKRSLPPEISIPIVSLISQLKHSDEVLPAPALEITFETTNRFHSILKSGAFSDYSASHKELENSNEKTCMVLEDVRLKGKSLIQRAEGALSAKRLSLDVIPIIPKVIDSAFGKLPGTLAQIAGDAAIKLLNNNKSIVIYQFSEWINEYHELRVSYLMNKSSANQR